MSLLSLLRGKGSASAKKAYQNYKKDEDKKKKAIQKKKEESKKNKQVKQSAPRAVTKASPVTNNKAKTSTSKVDKVKKNVQKSTQDAYKKYKQEDRNALGTKSKTTTTGSSRTAEGAKASLQAQLMTTAKAKADWNKTVKKWEDKNNQKLTDKQKKDAWQGFLKSDEYQKSMKDIDKEVHKQYSTKVKAKDLNAEDYLSIANATRMGNPKLTSSAMGDERARKVATKTASDYGKGGVSTFAQEFMNGASYVDNSQGLKFSQNEKNAIQKGKDSKAGKFGYMAGIGTTAAMGGVTGVEGALGKAIYKEGGKSVAKRFMANRLADMAINAPLNVADATKQATDIDGNFDKKEFAKSLGLNLGLDMAGGGIIDTGGLVLKKTYAKRIAEISLKSKKGIPLSEKDLNFLKKNVNRVDNEYEFVNDATSEIAPTIRKNTRNIAEQNSGVTGVLNTPNITNQAPASYQLEKASTPKPEITGAKSLSAFNDKADEINIIHNEALSRLDASASGDEIIDLGGGNKLVNVEGNIVKTDGVDSVVVPRAEAMAMIENSRNADLKVLNEATSDSAKSVSSTKANAKDHTLSPQGIKEKQTTVETHNIAKNEKQLSDAENIAKNGKTAEVQASKEIKETADATSKQNVSAQSVEESKDLKALTKAHDDLKTKIDKFSEYDNAYAHGDFEAYGGKKALEDKMDKIFKTEGEWDSAHRELKALEKKISDAKKKPPKAETTKPTTEKPKETKKVETEKPKEKVENKVETKVETKKGEEAKAKEMTAQANEPVKESAITGKELAKLKRYSKPTAENIGKLKGVSDEIDGLIRKYNSLKSEKAKAKVLDKIQKNVSDLVRKTEQSENVGDIVRKSDDTAKNTKAKKPRTHKTSEPSVKKQWDNWSKEEKIKSLDKVEKKVYTLEDAENVLERVKKGESIAKTLQGGNYSQTAPRLAEYIINNIDDIEASTNLVERMKDAGTLEKAFRPNMESLAMGTDKYVDTHGLDALYKKIMKQDEFVDDTATNAELGFAINGNKAINEFAVLYNKTGNEEYLQKIIDVGGKTLDTGGNVGYMLQSMKRFLPYTTDGRLKISMAEIKRLNKKYADRLDKPLELTTEEVQKIMNTDTLDDFWNVAKEIEDRLWDEIPATFMEKFNQWRHFSMLANPKTQLRNVYGNVVFALARTMSNGVETGLSRGVEKAVKAKTGNSDFKLTMSTRVDSKYLKENKEALDEAWTKYYDDPTREDTTRWFEGRRPEGKNEIKDSDIWGLGKWINKGTNLTYEALEKGDILTYKPAFKRAYARYCKSHNISLDGTASALELRRATDYASKVAKNATYRDDTYLSRKLVEWKTTTAGNTGKSRFSKVGYRALNTMLESVLPFVKTPINVFSRMTDYSPIGFGRSLALLGVSAHKKDVEALAQGIHLMSTGLTGGGVMLLGMHLTHLGLITVETGDVSGDAYYDRDMGYQDYSIKIGDYSLTADWLAPIATPFFMGAAYYNARQDDGTPYEKLVDTASALWKPMQNMSFMSSSKDMMDTFLENTSKRGGNEPNYFDAFVAVAGGSIPQGYLSSAIPQFLSQIATGTDNYARDTSSTKENDFAKGWESWLRKAENRIPVVREMVLNPKTDRKGNYIETIGGNYATKMLNALVNPASTKKITYDKYDKEIIKITKGLIAEGKEKDANSVFWNLTGNPSYDLYGGGRMSYKDKTKYQRVNRQSQWNLLKEMVNDKGSAELTNNLKYKELDMSNKMATIDADRKVYGNKYALKKILNGEYANAKEKEAYKIFKATGGKDGDYLDFYQLKETTIGQKHCPNYYTKGMVAVAYGRKFNKSEADVKKVATAFQIYEDKMESAKQYYKEGGSLKEYITANKRIVGTMARNGALSDGGSISKRNQAVSFGLHEKGVISKRSMKAMGVDGDALNMGYALGHKDVGFKKKYSFKELLDIKTQYTATGNTDGKGSITKDETEAFVNTLGIKDSMEKACIFYYLYGRGTNGRTPFGNIPNFLKTADAKSGSGSGRRYGHGRRYYGHRRYGHGGHGGGGGGNGGSSNYLAWLKSQGTDQSGSSSSSVKYTKATLNEAFRKRQLKMLKATTGRTGKK